MTTLSGPRLSAGSSLTTDVNGCGLNSGLAAGRSSDQGPEVPRLLRRTLMRNWVIRAIPAMATTTPPATAAISRASPSGIVPAAPRK